MSQKYPFNLEAYAKENGLNPTRVTQLVKKKGYNISSKRTVLLKKKTHDKLIACIANGFADPLQNGAQKEVSKASAKVQQQQALLKSLEKKEEGLQAQKREHQNNLSIYNSLTREIATIAFHIEQTLQRYRKQKAEAALKLDSHYQTMVSRRKQLSSKRATYLDERATNATIRKVEEAIEQTKKSKKEQAVILGVLLKEFELKKLEEKEKQKKEAAERRAQQQQSAQRQSSTSANHPTDTKVQRPPVPVVELAPKSYTYSILWQDVHFYDGYVIFKIGNRLLKQFLLKDSRKSFNHIKALYKFRNAPLIEVEVTGNTVLKILNLEVFFYYLHFLSFGDSFDNKLLLYKQFCLANFQHYSKAFYQKHLPQLFQPKCFDYLCQHALEGLPIIPVLETVINSSGQQQIHDSFLFPLSKQKGVTWVWESVEESKASYVFKTTGEEIKSLQLIFDYLTGNTINKRQNLIYNKRLADKLNLQKRIMHNSEQEWKSEIRYVKQWG